MTSYSFTLHWKSEPSYFMQPEASVGSPCSSSSTIAKQCPLVLEQTYYLCFKSMFVIKYTALFNHKPIKNNKTVTHRKIQHSGYHTVWEQKTLLVFSNRTLQWCFLQNSLPSTSSYLQGCLQPATHIQLLRNKWGNGKAEI